MVTITTNIHSVVSALQAKLLTIADKNNVVRIVATTMAAKVAKRIFVNGQSADGGKIGTYSTKPIYVDPKNSPKKFSGKGKNDKRASKDHKTRYFEDGYKGFREFIGRESSFVNLSLSRHMANSFTSGIDNKLPVATPLGYGIGFLNSEYTDRANYFETKYGKRIFALTELEKDSVKKVAEQEVHKIFGNQNIRGRI